MFPYMCANINYVIDISVVYRFAYLFTESFKNQAILQLCPWGQRVYLHIQIAASTITSTNSLYGEEKGTSNFSSKSVD